MREHGKVYSAFWGSHTASQLTDDGRMLALYLLTCPHGSALGAFRLPGAYVAEDLQWSPERVRSAFGELDGHGFARKCHSTGWVWIVNYLAWNQPDNPNQRKGLARQAEKIPAGCDWRDAFMAAHVNEIAQGAAHTISSEPANNPQATNKEPLRNRSETLAKPLANPSETHTQPLANPSETVSEPFGNPSQTVAEPPQNPLEAVGKQAVNGFLPSRGICILKDQEKYRDVRNTEIQNTPRRAAQVVELHPGEPESDHLPPPSINLAAKPKREKATIGVDDLVAEGADRQAAQDWLQVRKAKKSPLTLSGWNGVKREAAKAGVSPADAVSICAERGWLGLKAEWLNQPQAKGQTRSQPQRPAERVIDYGKSGLLSEIDLPQARNGNYGTGGPL